MHGDFVDEEGTRGGFVSQLLQVLVAVGVLAKVVDTKRLIHRVDRIDGLLHRLVGQHRKDWPKYFFLHDLSVEGWV